MATGPLVPFFAAVPDVTVHLLASLKQPLPQPLGGLALIDTGATRTVIQADIPARLALHPVGTTLVHSASNANVPCDEYLIKIVIQTAAIDVRVVAMTLQGQAIQCLIGRDVLSLGVLVYTGPTNAFSFSL